MSEALKVGDTLWKFDINRRVYPEGRTSFIGGGPPIYREHFTEFVIYGETRGMWLVRSARAGYQASVNKKTLQERQGAYSPIMYFTPQGMEDNIWSHHHRPMVVRLLQDHGRTSATQVRAVAELLGYKDES